jgi:hypothetical protein
MASSIDATKPVDNVPASKADLRQNLSTAKTEIEELMRKTTYIYQIVQGTVVL